jgi:hypothetical protein
LQDGETAKPASDADAGFSFSGPFANPDRTVVRFPLPLHPSFFNVDVHQFARGIVTLLLCKNNANFD